MKVSQRGSGGMARKPKPKPDYLAVVENDQEEREAPEGERRSLKIEPLPVPITLQGFDGADHAVRAWSLINEHLATMGLLASVDVLQLEILCAAVGRWHWCQDQYREPGPDGRTPKGRYYKISGRNGTQHKTRPEVHDEREAVRVINSLGSSFGLDPVARQRLLGAAAGGDDDSDLFD